MFDRKRTKMKILSKKLEQKLTKKLYKPKKLFTTKNVLTWIFSQKGKF